MSGIIEYLLCCKRFAKHGDTHIEQDTVPTINELVAYRRNTYMFDDVKRALGKHRSLHKGNGCRELSPWEHLALSGELTFRLCCLVSRLCVVNSLDKSPVQRSVYTRNSVNFYRLFLFLMSLCLQVEEAGQVFLLMKKDYRISRNVRLAWFLNHLHQTVQATPQEMLVRPRNLQGGRSWLRRICFFKGVLETGQETNSEGSDSRRGK